RVPFTLTGSDPDGDPLLFNITSFPSQGILDGFVPNLVYIPNDGYVGEDSFTFVVFDGYEESEPATVSIWVTNAPIADPQTVTTVHDQRVPFTLTGSDPDGEALLFNITSFPSQGILDGFVPNLVYIPNDGYVGEDSFTFVVFDGYVESEPATVTIQVNNNAPVADPLMVTTSVGERVPFTLTGSDPDGDPLLFNITSFPSQGILDGFVPNLVYIPNDGYVGEDSFTFVVFDGYEESEPATVSINIIQSEPVIVFEDDFESSTGWVRNPYGTDTARRGLWEIANPESVWYFGYKQLGTTVSGDKDLVTGARAGWLPGDNDVDYGTTSMRSPLISLPADKSISLSLSYYLAHASNSSSSDYLRIIVIGQETNTIFEVLGRNRDVDAAWTGLAIDLSGFAGQQVYLLIEVADLGNPSLVEAAVDDILIIAQ
ncbi:MAG TPA: Ig-like domain-containing protein, partial [Cyclobacteriaceae bacterium]|nr:Ig-like domain-containing protein [Cyclobacteriaceae bacterium]